MQKTKIITTLALVAIAINMTYSNFRTAAGNSSAIAIAEEQSRKPLEVEEKVLPVLGQAWVTFDGFGSKLGYMVKDGENLKIVRPNKVLAIETAEWKPRFFSKVNFKGEETYMPIVLEQYK